MSHELARAIRDAYDDFDFSESTQPTDSNIDKIFFALKGKGETQCVAAVWSAVRALIFPQIPREDIEACLIAIGRVVHFTLPRTSKNIPTEVLELIRPQELSSKFENQKAEARRCLGYALFFCIDQRLTYFRQVIKALGVAQEYLPKKPVDLTKNWIGWLDDVVSRSDRFQLSEIYNLLERCVAGTLEKLPSPFFWEGTADDRGRLEVWAVDAHSRNLDRLIMAIDSVELRGNTLNIIISDTPCLVQDPLRIEYFVEHCVHRRFLGGIYEGHYQNISYRCLATSEEWEAPA